MLRNDTSADVRKAVLCNFEFTKPTLSLLIERLRDVDVNIRKYIFRSVLVELGDMRIFTITERESILDMGLSDRCVSVITIIQVTLHP
jgi:condensin complex subunit 3